MIQIYHNSRCGKSRTALVLLLDSKKEVEIINYLVIPPTIDELVQLLKKLNFKPIDLVRKKEKIWTENFKNLKMSDIEIIKTLSTYPILIERPILVNGTNAIIARETEKIIAFLTSI